MVTQELKESVYKKLWAFDMHGPFVDWDKGFEIMEQWPKTLTIDEAQVLFEWIINPTGHEAYVEEGGIGLIGVEIEELLGNQWKIRTEPEYRVQFIVLLRQYASLLGANEDITRNIMHILSYTGDIEFLPTMMPFLNHNLYPSSFSDHSSKNWLEDFDFIVRGSIGRVMRYQISEKGKAAKELLEPFLPEIKKYDLILYRSITEDLEKLHN